MRYFRPRPQKSNFRSNDKGSLELNGSQDPLRILGNNSSSTQTSIEDGSMR